MTRKDYELIAASLKDARQRTDWAEPYGPHQLEGIEIAAVALADNLTHTNPRFDRLRFLTASGVEL